RRGRAAGPGGEERHGGGGVRPPGREVRPRGVDEVDLVLPEALPKEEDDLADVSHLQLLEDGGEAARPAVPGDRIGAEDAERQRDDGGTGAVRFLAAGARPRGHLDVAAAPGDARADRG